MLNSVLYQSRFGEREDLRAGFSHLLLLLANYLLESIDESIEPCENFFQFACGTWLKNNRIPDDSFVRILFSGSI